MKRVVTIGVVIAGLFLSQVASSQALRPQVIPEDRTSPRGTLKLLRTAMEQGDAEQIHAILAAETQQEKAMVQSMAATAVSVKRLHDAAIAAFGAEDARALTGQPTTPGPDGLTDLDRATESIAEDGQSATVAFEDVSARPIKLTRQGEQWQIPIGELKQLEAEALNERIAEVQALNTIVDELAGEVTAGKYKSAEEAKQALYNKLIQNARAPGTQPVTQPANPEPATQPAD